MGRGLSAARLPFQSWLQLMISSMLFFMFGSFTGDLHPISNAPMLGAHKGGLSSEAAEFSMLSVTPTRRPHRRPPLPSGRLTVVGKT